ncbi:MAG TPA: hypothetical protein VFA75_01820 [Nevskia sp.]|nr:hypothetical protein [Nevskia sp.]
MSQQDDDLNLFLFTLAPNSLWRSAPVRDEPEVHLRDWDIRQDTAGRCYFVGTRADNGDGRVSTPIVEFDAEHRRGRTRSGRVYELLGPSGRSRNGEYVWSLYKTANGITEARG